MTDNPYQQPAEPAAAAAPEAKHRPGLATMLGIIVLSIGTGFFGLFFTCYGTWAIVDSLGAASLKSIDLILPISLLSALLIGIWAGRKLYRAEVRSLAERAAERDRLKGERNGSSPEGE